MLLKRRMAGWLALCAVLAMAGAQESPKETQSLVAGTATIGQVKGDVSLLAPQQAPAVARPGAVLSPGTTLETRKGSAVLQLEDGSQVLVKSNTRVVLKAPAEADGHYFDLLLGKIVAKVKKRLSGSPSFRMGTPTAVITVRGTEFEVEFSKKGVTNVEVHEGLVEVAGLGVMGPPVLLRPGFGTEVRPQRLPEPPREMNERWEPGEGLGGRDREFGDSNGPPGAQQPGEHQGQGAPESESEPH